MRIDVRRRRRGRPGDPRRPGADRPHRPAGPDDAATPADVDVVGAGDVSPDVNVMDAAALAVPDVGASHRWTTTRRPARGPRHPGRGGARAGAARAGATRRAEPARAGAARAGAARALRASTLDPERAAAHRAAGWAQPAEPVAAPAWPPPAASPPRRPPRRPPTAARARRPDPGRQLGPRRVRPQPARASPASRRHRRARHPVARLTFSSGEVVEVDRAVIVGRAPEARRFTSTEQPRLVTVPSPQPGDLLDPPRDPARRRRRPRLGRASPTSARPTAPCSSSRACRPRTSSPASPSS